MSDPTNIYGLPRVLPKESDTTSSNVKLLTDIANGRVEQQPVRWGNVHHSPNVNRLLEVLESIKESDRKNSE